MTILAAVQANKTTVRVTTNKGTKLITGILVSYTSETVVLKNSNTTRLARVCDENGHQIRTIPI